MNEPSIQIKRRMAANPQTKLAELPSKTANDDCSSESLLLVSCAQGQAIHVAQSQRPTSEVVYTESGDFDFTNDPYEDNLLNEDDVESDEDNNGPRRFLQKARSLSESLEGGGAAGVSLNLYSPPPTPVFKEVDDFKQDHSRRSRPSSFMPETVIASDVFSSEGTKELAKLLECPICMEITTVPVLLCERGHIVCNMCRNKSDKCPLCQGLYSQIRNFLADELIKKCFAKCKYSSVGCNVRLLENEKCNHEQDCDFRPFECSLVGELHTCKKSLIRYEKFKNHILHGHQLKGASTDYGEWFEEATAEDLKLMIDHVNEFAYLECFEKLFLCASEIHDGKMMWWIYIIGSKNEAAMFEAEINITHLEKNVSLSWNGPVHSIRESSRTVFRSGLGLLVTSLNLRPLTTYLPKTKKYEWVVGFHVSKNV